MQRLCVAFPIYNQVSSTFFFRWLRIDKTSVTQFVGIDCTEVTLANTLLVKEALALDNWDRLVIFEHDMIVPLDALARIATYHQQEHSIVGSVYFARYPPHHTVAYIEHDQDVWPLSAGTVQDWCATPALYEVDAVGFGLTSIGRHVLEDWDPAVRMFGTDDRFLSHDMWFCHQAKQQGHHIFLDSGIVCDHLTVTPISAADNLRCAPTDDGGLVDFSYIAPPLAT